MASLIHAYSFHGDVEGTTRAVVRYKAMGYTPTLSVLNNILRAKLNSPGQSCWHDIAAHFETSYGEIQSKADHVTYQIFLAACHKYQRPREALFWFNEVLTRGRLDVSCLKKPLLQVIGSGEYDNYRDKLSPRERSIFDIHRRPEKHLNRTPRRRREAKAAAAEAAERAHVKSSTLNLVNSKSLDAHTPDGVAVTEPALRAATSVESRRTDEKESLPSLMPMAWHTIN